jgi:uncharacterized protein with HEPN domain
MPRKYRLYLEDIVKSATKIERYIENTADAAEFKSDDFTIDAVLHNLMIIGEAAKNIPSAVKDNYPEVDWQGANRLRNLIAHVYFAVNLRRIWDFIQNDMPQLKLDIEKILSDLDQSENEQS